jgi:MFS family permease
MGGRFTVGLGVGAMSMVCPTYVSELSPKHIRGRITGLFQVIVVIGVAGMIFTTICNATTDNQLHTGSPMLSDSLTQDVEIYNGESPSPSSWYQSESWPASFHS